MVETVHQKLPSFSKSQLRNKVREISDFVDNRWQVRNLFPNILGCVRTKKAVNAFILMVFFCC